MSDFYSLESDSGYWEYVSPDFSKLPSKFREACISSNFQYIDKSPIKLEILENSGNIFPDFMYNVSESIPLISNRLKNIFDDFNIDNLLYKRVNLFKKSTNVENLYWLALPPRIDCLDYEHSTIDEIQNSVDTIRINSNNAGIYDIFKILGVNNNEIIITKRFFEYLSKYDNLESIYFTSIN